MRSGTAETAAYTRGSRPSLATRKPRRILSTRGSTGPLETLAGPQSVAPSSHGIRVPVITPDAPPTPLLFAEWSETLGPAVAEVPHAGRALLHPLSKFAHQRAAKTPAARAEDARKASILDSDPARAKFTSPPVGPDTPEPRRVGPWKVGVACVFILRRRFTMGVDACCRGSSRGIGV